LFFCGTSLGFNPTYKEAAIELGNYFVNNDIGLVYEGGK
jgi:predicted Rossmann-fold nucleotide-binding protein